MGDGGDGREDRADSIEDGADGTSERYTPSRKAKVVGAIQWAAVGFSASTAVWQAVSDYYLFVRDSFFSLGIPEPFGTILYGFVVVSLLGGLVGGYFWVGRHTDSAEQESREHRTRVSFLLVLLSLGIVSLVVEMAASELLGDRFYTVPYFLLSPILDLLVLGATYALVYRSDIDWTDVGGTSADGAYRPSRVAGAVGGVQWAVTALYLGFVAFGLVGEYLLRTRESFSLDLGGWFVAGVAAAFVVGYVWSRRLAESSEAARSAHHDRVEYLLSVFALGLVLSLVSGIVLTAFPSLGFDLSILWFVTIVFLSLSLSFLSVYVAKLDLLGRLLST